MLGVPRKGSQGSAGAREQSRPQPALTWNQMLRGSPARGALLRCGLTSCIFLTDCKRPAGLLLPLKTSGSKPQGRAPCPGWEASPRLLWSNPAWPTPPVIAQSTEEHTRNNAVLESSQTRKRTSSLIRIVISSHLIKKPRGGSQAEFRVPGMSLGSGSPPHF